MMMKTCFSVCFCLFAAMTGVARGSGFESDFQPLIVKHCAKCHGNDADDIRGDVDLVSIKSMKQFLAKEDLAQKVYEAIEGGSMPPESAPPLDKATRAKMLELLAGLLRQASSSETNANPIRRLNRFQYNNTVRDLFRLNRNVFPLPEKLMTRKSDYLLQGLNTRKMPANVKVTSNALQPLDGMKNVRAFPKDLRASHGFDNQANQLTLSPLLLDAFLRLSISIVESPDFTEANVGVWNELFAEPEAEYDPESEIRQRLKPFMRQAFRRPVSDDALSRYVGYTKAKFDAGLGFTDAMKKAASAVMSSPKFYFRSQDEEHSQYRLASELSYCLWGSCPDQELLDSAAKKELSDSKVLAATIDRMIADPKIERFLDTFPSQWMQLENTLAATPDPKQYPLFSILKKSPASLHMILEPLLLFDSVFIENRPIMEMIAPDYTYRSELLKTWYTTELKPPPVDLKAIRETNQQNDKRRADLAKEITTVGKQLAELVDPIRKRLLIAKGESAEDSGLDLKPYSVWEFDSDLQDSVHSLHLKPTGKHEMRDGMVHLNKSFLISEKLNFDLRAKSLEIRFQLSRLDQAGGGLMGVQGPGDFFDTIVIGERKPRHWISGSNGFSRTKDFPKSTPEDRMDAPIHLVMVYDEDGTTRLYRDGKPYGESFNKGRATFPKNETSILFGLRHLPPGGNKFLNVSIDRAVFYDRALTAEEVQAAAQNQLYIRPAELLAEMTTAQQKQNSELNAQLGDLRKAITAVAANRDVSKAVKQSRVNYENQIKRQLRSDRFQRVPIANQRYGGVITNAAMFSMTSGPDRTHPIARGAWIIEVIFNDPPPPPPNDVPPLNEDASAEHLTIREKFAKHREAPNCAGCHARLDPLGFAMENFDITGRWRDKYKNGRKVDASGRLLNRYDFDGIVDFKNSLQQEKRRFAKAFTKHLLRYALSRELKATDLLTVDTIIRKSEDGNFAFRDLLHGVLTSSSFTMSDVK